MTSNPNEPIDPVEDKGDQGQPAVENNQQASQFEVTVEGSTAVLTYRRTQSELVLLHAGVPVALRGHGLANRLARTALEFARDHSLVVVPLCPFMVTYLKRHHEWAALVSPEYRARIQA